jgi:hypothetical protein
MRTIIQGIFSFLLLFSQATQAQTQPDERYKIKLLINNQPIEGSQERALRLKGKSQADQLAIVDEKMPTLKSGSSFQLTIKVTEPDGITRDYSQSGRLAYEHFGCLSINSIGFVLVTPSGVCAGPEYPRIWVLFKDQNNNPIMHNEYQFQLTP